MFDNAYYAYYISGVMKTHEFTKKISKAGCYITRHGKKHDIWLNPKTGGETTVDRHGSQELAKGTVDGMLKDLGLK